MRISMGILTAVLATTACMPLQGAKAQPSGPDQPDMVLTAETRTQIIANLLGKLDANYVFPDVAKKMDAALHKRLENKEYDKVTSAKSFAELLTKHLQEVSHDGHLRVRFSYEMLPTRKEDDQPSAAEIEQYRTWNQQVNFGFEKVERLNGNIGYLDLRGFFDPEMGGDTVAGAMTLLANTDALIIDLRQNGGGSPEMVQLICSYFFEGEPVHLNDLYFRPSDTTRQYWTLPHVPGKRYVGKEVYILTSHRTFSGAEEFSYNMKNLKRATLIGETTGGGAHPGDMARINDHFAIFVPSGRAINPITKTNWEGTGVTPDVAAPAEQALKTAQVAALKHLLAKTTDGPRAGQLKEVLETTEKELAALQANKTPEKP
ncbi:MAG TPA: S41 family peptidase [Chthonomonadaceae bacterium]|nr:S41 family peptidase [Chthonomonadaceae bacterium]